MKYAVNPFVMKQGETHVVFSDPSLYTYQNVGTETAVIEGSNDAVTWHHIADVPAGEDLLSVHSHKYLRMLNNTVVYVNRGIGAVATVNGKTGIVVLDQTDIGLDQVDNTSDLNKPISTSTQDALDLKADLVNGVIPTSQIPAIAITDFLGDTNTEAAMLALVGQKGDWCIRTDLEKVFIITGDDPTLLASWTALEYPTSPVSSVNGKTGSVVLVKADVGLDNVDNTSDADKPISTSTQDALDLKADLVGGLIPESQLPQSALEDTTYQNATTSTDGLMSKEDKTKLDALQQVYIIQLTQAAYDALTPEQKNQENTIYAIVG